MILADLSYQGLYVCLQPGADCPIRTDLPGSPHFAKIISLRKPQWLEKKGYDVRIIPRG
jgi:hypothetical protein